jgi:hypothetical protein
MLPRLNKWFVFTFTGCILIHMSTTDTTNTTHKPGKRTITIDLPDGQTISYQSGAKAIKRFAVVRRIHEAAVAAEREGLNAYYEDNTANGSFDADGAAKRSAYADERFASLTGWHLLSEHGTAAAAAKAAPNALAGWNGAGDVEIVPINDPAI